MHRSRIGATSLLSLRHQESERKQKSRRRKHKLRMKNSYHFSRQMPCRFWFDCRARCCRLLLMLWCPWAPEYSEISWCVCYGLQCVWISLFWCVCVRQVSQGCGRNGMRRVCRWSTVLCLWWENPSCTQRSTPSCACCTSATSPASWSPTPSSRRRSGRVSVIDAL